MRTLYIECKMGAAGDMLMAALYELLDEPQKAAFLKQMNEMFAPDIQIAAEPKTAAGICGTHMHVLVHGEKEAEHGHDPDAHSHGHIHGHDAHEHDHDVHSHGHTHDHAHDDDHHDHDHHHTHSHAHHSYASIAAKISTLPLSADTRSHASSIYRLIGEAEAKVHGTDIEQIHFHEVGSLDAVADVVGVCLLYDILKIDRVVVSPIHVGNGMVHCAHGILPVPAPATAEILRGVPFYTGGVDTELCTPTGAAILKHFAADFGAMPVMAIDRAGVGHGTKELPMLNAVRAFLGNDAAASDGGDRILDISCNLDDMTGEALGFAMDKLLEAGALDVFYIPIQMKKNRPGILLHCFCAPSEKDRFAELVLKYTTTRGVRYQSFERKKLTSRFETEASAFGPITRKISEGYGISKTKYEYEDLKRIAEENGLSLQELAARLEGKDPKNA